MTIDQQCRSAWKRISTPSKAAFLGCLVAGYPVHLYAFTNLIPNADGLGRVYDPQDMLIAGRWFLRWANSFNSFTQMPAAIGLVTLLLLGVAAALTADLLELRSPVLAGLAGALFSTFPCLGYTFLYMFTASAYAVAILLAVLSVHLAKRGRLGWLLGVAALALSMGTYQAYVTVAISLALLSVLRQTMDPEAGFRDTLFLGLRYMAFLAAGAVLYYGMLRLCLLVRGMELWSYLGMDAAAGSYPFAQLPRLFLRTYKESLFFFFVPGAAGGFSSPWMVVLDLFAFVLAFACFLTRMSGKGLWKEPWRAAGALAMLVLLPLGINFTQLLSPYSTPTPLMKYAFVCVYLAVLMSVDLADGASAAGWYRKVMGPAAVLWAASLLLFNLNTNNLLYTASAQAHRATESYLTRLLVRIEDCPGYEPGMEIAIIGAIPEDQLRAQVESYAQVSHYSVPQNRVATSNKHIYYYLNDWLNFPVEEPSEETMIAVSDSPEFQAMPLYPAQGSVQVLDGRLVVRLRETYTPKQPYELQYESIR